MNLTNKQEAGLKLAIERYKNKERYAVIAGYAGTGKSTLVKYIISALCAKGVNPERVCYAAYTGKAAQVLQKKGHKNVSTLHHLLFESVPKGDGTFFHRKKKFIDYDVVVVDEISMAPKSLMQTLYSHKNIYILALGDPFQLPPVYKDEDNHLLDSPHIFLDEVMRQAADNEIIKTSMMIREGKPLSYYKGENVQILPQNIMNEGMLLWADQILVAKNDTRVSINNQMRNLLGRGDMPEKGDKVICLRNYWDDFSANSMPLINGCIGYLAHDIHSDYISIPYFMRRKYFDDFNNLKSIDVLRAGFKSDDGDDYGMLEMDKKLILTGEDSLNPRQNFLLGKLMPLPKEFTYGYAITGHKSQGSEWEKVLVIEEKFPFGKEEHARWLYTVCTRASDKLVLLR